MCTIICLFVGSIELYIPEHTFIKSLIKFNRPVKKL